MTANLRPLSWLMILLVAATACTPDATDSGAIVLENYRTRVAQLTAAIVRDCREEVIAAAILRADSLLIDRANRMRRVEGRPPRPNRPGAPPVKELSQPLPLRPLFPFEIRFDTLLRDSLYLDSLRFDSIDRGLLPQIRTEELEEEG
jgi:hypothetical protein